MNARARQTYALAHRFDIYNFCGNVRERTSHCWKRNYYIKSGVRVSYKRKRSSSEKKKGRFKAINSFQQLFDLKETSSEERTSSAWKQSRSHGHRAQESVVPELTPVFHEGDADLSKRKNYKAQAAQLLQEVRKENDDDLVSYNIALSMCTRSGDWKLALWLLDEMVSKDLQPDVRSYSSAIWACAKKGNWQSAVSLLDDMQRIGVIPNEITYNAAITACGNAGKWRKALDIFNTMDTNGVKPNVFIYNALISSLGKGMLDFD